MTGSASPWRFRCSGRDLDSSGPRRSRDLEDRRRTDDLCTSTAAWGLAREREGSLGRDPDKTYIVSVY